MLCIIFLLLNEVRRILWWMSFQEEEPRQYCCSTYILSHFQRRNIRRRIGRKNQHPLLALENSTPPPPFFVPFSLPLPRYGKRGGGEIPFHLHFYSPLIPGREELEERGEGDRPLKTSKASRRERETRRTGGRSQKGGFKKLQKGKRKRILFICIFSSSY